MRLLNKQSDIFKRLASALMKLTSSASANFGADCVLHAQLAQAILQEEGITTRLVVGEAAWRIGAGDGDVIAHSPKIGGYAPAGSKALAFHAWLESESAIIDFSTHSLRAKAAQLDALDGGKTSVDWSPPYLVLERTQVVPLNEVAQAASAGVAFYREIPELNTLIVELCPSQRVVSENRDILRMLFDQPQIVVHGRNNMFASNTLLVAPLACEQI